MRKEDRKTCRVESRLKQKDYDNLMIDLKERTRPDPKNPAKKISFKSKQDYIEFWIRALHTLSKWRFNLLSEMTNPDHPDFPD